MVQQRGLIQQRDLRSLSIDLTTARTEMAYTIPLHPLKGILFWCDGSKSGISVKIGEQSRQSIGIEQVSKLPVYGDPWQIYITNDVRSGRSTLVVFFVDDDLKLDLTNFGDPVSNAELAARLGSPDTFDRRGDVLWMDDFESGLKWRTSLLGTGSLIDLTATMAASGGKCCRLVTGSANNDYAYLLRHFL